METFSTTMPYTFADSISKDTVSIIEENSKSLPGVTVKVTTTRQYEDGTIAVSYTHLDVYKRQV